MTISLSTTGLAHPLACNPEDGLSTWAVDTLHRASITLHLLADLLGSYNGEQGLLTTDNQRFALYLQLSSLADLLAAVSDSLNESKKAKAEAAQ